MVSFQIESCGGELEGTCFKKGDHSVGEFAFEFEYLDGDCGGFEGRAGNEGVNAWLVVGDGKGA